MLLELSNTPKEDGKPPKADTSFKQRFGRLVEDFSDEGQLRQGPPGEHRSVDKPMSAQEREAWEISVFGHPAKSRSVSKSKSERVYNIVPPLPMPPQDATIDIKDRLSLPMPPIDLPPSSVAVPGAKPAAKGALSPVAPAQSPAASPSVSFYDLPALPSPKNGKPVNGAGSPASSRTPPASDDTFGTEKFAASTPSSDVVDPYHAGWGGTC